MWQSKRSNVHEWFEYQGLSDRRHTRHCLVGEQASEWKHFIAVELLAGAGWLN